ncbi:transmembrane protein 120B isoform X1 [Chelonia mydas]|uniref:transmembrane protein 120B isoform X1 n=2 Tax=Chelonia mydas TaxID=8469 RepID=UPI0018A24383|nr:transmembrane protein 120B isoform X1 [Chelonia mydas]
MLLQSERYQREWRELEEEFQQLQETHKVYRQKLEELNNLQAACSSSIRKQKRKLKDLKYSLQRCKHKSSPEESDLIQQINTQIKDRQNIFFDMEAYLPKRNGLYLNLVLGNVNVTLLSNQAKFAYKDEYEKFKLYLTIILLLGAVACRFILHYRVTDEVFNFLLVWYYCTLTIRESILISNGSSCSRGSQIRRRKKRTQDDVFSEILDARAVSDHEQRPWRMNTADSREKGPGAGEGDAPGHNGAFPTANTDAVDTCGPTGSTVPGSSPFAVPGELQNGNSLHLYTHSTFHMASGIHPYPSTGGHHGQTQLQLQLLIKGWWVSHHYVSTFLSGVMLTWPDGLMYQMFRNQFLAFSIFQSCVQFLQYYYQSGCLYRLCALGKRNHLDLTVEGFQSWMWRGLTFLLPFLFFGHFWQLYNAITLFELSRHTECKEWQVFVLALTFLLLFLGNFLTTLKVVHTKLQKNEDEMKKL